MRINNEQDNETSAHTDKKINNVNNFEKKIKEQKATEIKYYEDCSDDDYLDQLLFHVKFEISNIFTDEVKKNMITLKKKVLNYEENFKDRLSNNREITSSNTIKNLIKPENNVKNEHIMTIKLMYLTFRRMMLTKTKVFIMVETKLLIKVQQIMKELSQFLVMMLNMVTKGN